MAEAPTFSLSSIAGGPTHVYVLETGDHRTKSAIYLRKDGQRVKWDDDFGWSARDDKGALLTLAWGVPAASQGDAPPEGTWVGRKGDSVFLYHLKYDVSAADKKAQAQRYREAVGGVEM